MENVCILTSIAIVFVAIYTLVAWLYLSIKAFMGRSTAAMPTHLTILLKGFEIFGLVFVFLLTLNSRRDNGGRSPSCGSPYPYTPPRPSSDYFSPSMAIDRQTAEMKREFNMALAENRRHRS